jgi:cell shape-determining protein MreC
MTIETRLRDAVQALDRPAATIPPFDRIRRKRLRRRGLALGLVSAVTLAAGVAGLASRDDVGSPQVATSPHEPRPTVAPNQTATAISAKVIRRPGDAERSIQINKGSDQGVNPGAFVITRRGLVGRVTQASGDRATVILIDDPAFGGGHSLEYLGISVRLENTNLVGVTMHTGSDISLYATGVAECGKSDAPDTCISKGELAFTTDIEGSALPPDIPVARVAKIIPTPGVLEATILLKPLVDLDDLRYVKVLVQS